MVAWTLMERVEFDSYNGTLDRPKPGYRESESVAMVPAELTRAGGVSNLYGVLGAEHLAMPSDAEWEAMRREVERKRIELRQRRQAKRA